MMVVMGTMNVRMDQVILLQEIIIAKYFIRGTAADNRVIVPENMDDIGDLLHNVKVVCCHNHGFAGRVGIEQHFGNIAGSLRIESCSRLVKKQDIRFHDKNRGDTGFLFFTD